MAVINNRNLGVPLAEWRAHEAGARAGAATVRRGNVDEGDGEGGVEDDGDEARERVAGDAAEQQQGASRVEGGKPGDALDGADPGADVEAVVLQRGEEVAEDGEDESGAGELEAAEEVLEGLESVTGTGEHGGSGREVDDGVGWLVMSLSPLWWLAWYFGEGESVQVVAMKAEMWCLYQLSFGKRWADSGSRLRNRVYEEARRWSEMPEGSNFTERERVVVLYLGARITSSSNTR